MKAEKMQREGDFRRRSRFRNDLSTAGDNQETSKNPLVEARSREGSSEEWPPRGRWVIVAGGFTLPA